MIESIIYTQGTVKRPRSVNTPQQESHQPIIIVTCKLISTTNPQRTHQSTEDEKDS